MNAILFLVPAPLLTLLFANAIHQEASFSLLTGSVLLAIVLAWGTQFTLLSLKETVFQDAMKVVLFGFLYYLTWDYPPYDVIVLGAFLGTITGSILNQFSITNVS